MYLPLKMKKSSSAVRNNVNVIIYQQPREYTCAAHSFCCQVTKKSKTYFHNTLLLVNWIKQR